ncbi:SAM-dependent methyltransferase [Streptomyces albulus]|nr:SAM-dependent methyltransferase [Streptomyces noursei]
MTQFEQWDIVTGVGLTALGVAAGRALETERPDHLVSDPYAAAFVAAADPPVPVPQRLADTTRMSDVARDVWTSMAQYLGVRSRFFDRFLMTAAAGGVRQVVVTAAGLDARAFRLDWPPGTELFEIDQPRVLAFRTASSTAAAPAPLRPPPGPGRPAGRLAHGAPGRRIRPDRATAWLAEGLLPFLPADAELRFLDRIGRLSAPGSRLAAEHLAPSVRPSSRPRSSARPPANSAWTSPTCGTSPARRTPTGSSPPPAGPCGPSRPTRSPPRTGGTCTV